MSYALIHIVTAVEVLVQVLPVHGIRSRLMPFSLITCAGLAQNKIPNIG